MENHCFKLWSPLSQASINTLRKFPQNHSFKGERRKLDVDILHPLLFQNLHRKHTLILSHKNQECQKGWPTWNKLRTNNRMKITLTGERILVNILNSKQNEKHKETSWLHSTTKGIICSKVQISVEIFHKDLIFKTESSLSLVWKSAKGQH